MAINFPASPTSGATFTNNNTTWQYDGTAWNIVTSSSPVNIPNSFTSVAVSGQNTLAADAAEDTLTLVAGENITITTDSAADSVTITSTAAGIGGEANQNAFSSIAVTGQTTIAADTTTDTVNFAAGTGITITTDALSDTVTITNSTSSSAFSALSDTATAGLDVSQIYENCITTLRVDNNSTIAYTFNSHYSGDNPTIYALSGTTIAFDLSQALGHPLEIQNSAGDPYNTGLVHVATDGTVSTEVDAQGKDSGTLYWRIQETVSGTYRYQCQSHVAMVGAITVKRFTAI